MANRTYQQSVEVDIARQLGPNITWDKGYDRIKQKLRSITRGIEEK
jgi:hypothetical protein